MKIFNSKGGGGPTPRPSDFPADKILLSGEDLRIYNDPALGIRYEPLDQDLVLTKEEAPKLWEYYNTGSDIFTILAVTSPASDKKYYILVE